MPYPIRHAILLVIVLGLSAPLAAQQAKTKTDGDTGRKPLNLSLPREVVTTPGSITRQDPTLRDNLRAPSRPADANDKATIDRTRSEPWDRTSDAPYGTGFEARQRGFGGPGFGGGGFGGGAGNGGGAGSGGGGRGMGRGR